MLSSFPALNHYGWGTSISVSDSYRWAFDWRNKTISESTRRRTYTSMLQNSHIIQFPRTHTAQKHGFKKNKNQKQNPHQNSALPRDWILKSPVEKPLQMTVCATTCESRKQSVADWSDLIIRSDSTERPEQSWQVSLSRPLGTRCPSVCDPPIRITPRSGAPQIYTHDPPARNRSRKWRREWGCEADHLDTHARGADRRAAAASCRRERRRLIYG